MTENKELDKLAEENKKLQYKLRNCEDTRKSYKQDWKACSSYCDEYKNKIISLKDEVDGLIKENKGFKKENEQLKQVLGSILIEVKQEISVSHKTGEIRVFINPNSFDLISDVLRRYGALKEWYDD